MDQVQNFIKEIVSGTHILADTTVNVVDASLFPDPASGQYNLTWWDATNYPDPSGSMGDPNREIVRVTGRDTGLNTLTVTRAQEGTVASNKNIVGATYLLALCPTKKNQDDIRDEIATKTTLATVQQDVSTNYGMARQAIMNGNFDVLQRGFTSAITDVTKIFVNDRWWDYADKNGGTLPTLARTVTRLTFGDIPNSFFYTSLSTNGAGTSLGVSSNHRFVQRIENGTRNLCGLGKKVTLSFWAKSSIANKRISPNLSQNYGTGGSPTAAEIILSGNDPITLTTSWTKYTITFTTNTLVGKTFGTGVDDYLALEFQLIWGTTWGNTNVKASVTAETYVGSGTINIAQVQLCSGDVALPFQPKSYEEELRACQRYYEVETGYGTGFAGNTTSSVAYQSFGKYRVTKRIAVTATWVSNTTTSGFPNSAPTMANGTTTTFLAYLAANASQNGSYYFINWTADAEL